MQYVLPATRPVLPVFITCLQSAAQVSRTALVACAGLAIGLGGLSLALGGCPNAAGAIVSGLCGLALTRLTRGLFQMPFVSKY